MHQGEALARVRLALLPEQGLSLDTPMTCDECKDNESCQFAFDMYNTDGDCLDSK